MRNHALTTTIVASLSVGLLAAGAVYIMLRAVDAIVGRYALAVARGIDAQLSGVRFLELVTSPGDTAPMTAPDPELVTRPGPVDEPSAAG